MKSLLIKTCILSLMLLVGFAMATTPPTGKEKAKKEVSSTQSAVGSTSDQATASNYLPANLPSWCAPQNCAPATCQPADCKPLNCNPSNCLKVSASCKAAGEAH